MTSAVFPDLSPRYAELQSLQDQVVPHSLIRLHLLFASFVRRTAHADGQLHTVYVFGRMSLSAIGAAFSFLQEPVGRGRGITARCTVAQHRIAM